jgi:ATP-dependent Lhr-like helicase
MAFDLLSYPVKRYICEKEWESFRPIQAAAITRIITTQDHYILSSKTASGKTEAAFLPVISLLKPGPGVQVLYISPLIALVNDQFFRIDALCRHMDIRVTRWHGEASRARKKKLLDNPEGILIITPESIESLFVNHPYHIPHLFSNLKFIILDEIHSFMGTERGVQLQSLIHRIKRVAQNPVRFIALSATLGSFEEVRSFFGEKEKTKILRDKSVREMSACFKYFDSEGKELPSAFILDLYKETQRKKSLIFPNTRGRVEEIAVKLKKMVERRKNSHFYFAHHSSVSRALRETAEQFARNSARDDFSIVCTSTLEMGIDIGTVELVVQVDSTFSVSSLIHRVGRSGRRPGEESSLLLYGTNPWSFLQSLACFELYKERFVEPVTAVECPVDILFHQILSILKETSGIKKDKFFKLIQKNFAFSSITIPDVDRLLDFMVQKDYIENMGDELILGLSAERVVNNRSFYSVFRTASTLKVKYQSKCIGELAFSPQLQINRNIFLAARIWKIVEIHHSKREVIVKPANDGQKPLFFGSSGNVHFKVREKMLEILSGGFLIDDYDCNDEGREVLNTLKKQFECFNIQNPQIERPLLETGNGIQFFTFSGTKINKTLSLLLRSLFGEDYFYDENKSCLDLPVDVDDLHPLLEKLNELLQDFETILNNHLAKDENTFIFTKWGKHLPSYFKSKLLLSSEFDVQGTSRFLDKCVIKTPLL